MVMTGLRFEVIPDGDDGGSLADRLLRVFPSPADVTLTVTSLPQHGLERTLRSAVELAGLGFRVVPHLPARSIADRAALSEVVHRMLGAGITEVFTVSGDAAHGSGGDSGTYTSSLELIRDLAELDAGLSIGIAGYPEGHPHFSDDHLLQHLLERAPFVDTIVTQLCYSPSAVARYAAMLCQRNVDAGLWVGVPGPVGLARLETLSDRLGVGRSKELLGRVGSDADRFDAAEFLREVRAQPEFALADAGARLAGAHVYTFNEIEGLPAFVEAVTVNHA
jgi:methylenetetrahydrofolate reductase (NADPH)